MRVAICAGGGDAPEILFEKVGTMSLEAVLGQAKLVPLDADTICTVREFGVSLGD